MFDIRGTWPVELIPPMLYAPFVLIGVSVRWVMIGYPAKRVTRHRISIKRHPTLRKPRAVNIVPRSYYILSGNDQWLVAVLTLRSLLESGLCIQSSSSGPAIIGSHSSELAAPSSACLALLSRLAELALYLAGGKRLLVGFAVEAEGPYCWLVVG